MGVPTFYRWLCCRYPRVVVDVGEGHVEQMREEMRMRKRQRRARRRAALAEERAARGSCNKDNAVSNSNRSSSDSSSSRRSSSSENTGSAAAGDAGDSGAAAGTETAATPAEVKDAESSEETQTEGKLLVKEEEKEEDKEKVTKKEEKEESQPSSSEGEAAATTADVNKEETIAGVVIEKAEEDKQESDDDDEEEEDFDGYDCLYLDMNGIVHPCCHTDDGGGPTSEEEMFLCIFQYIDRIVDLIQPRKLLYMAIDGVAPRAKMNQQRSRRFKTAKDIADEENAYEEIKQQFMSEGRDVPPKKVKWDSNVITPGTPFMHRLSVALTYYIQDRMANREMWKNFKVIFSDATVPGEGEHKIMDFIREQRKSSSYHPNLWHVLHGADADLIMLGLATHERNFCILREAVVDRSSNPPADAVAASSSCCSTCGAVGHTSQGCPFSSNSNDESESKEKKNNNSDRNPLICKKRNRIITEEAEVAATAAAAGQGGTGREAGQEEAGEKTGGGGGGKTEGEKEVDMISATDTWCSELEQHRRSWKPLQMLQLPILREYLQYELITVRGSEAAAENLERCIDDFVFLCFLCGNDFLPHLPHQSIQRGSIDALVELYIHLRPHTLTDYLTNEGTVNYTQLKIFLHHLSVIEEEVIRRDLQRKCRIREKNAQERQLQQQKDLLEAARTACMKVQQEQQQQKKQQQEMKKLKQEQTKQQQQQDIKGTHHHNAKMEDVGSSAAEEGQQQQVVKNECSLSNTCAAQQLKEILCKKAKDEATAAAGASQDKPSAAGTAADEGTAAAAAAEGTAAAAAEGTAAAAAEGTAEAAAEGTAAAAAEGTAEAAATVCSGPASVETQDMSNGAAGSEVATTEAAAGGDDGSSVTAAAAASADHAADDSASHSSSSGEEEHETAATAESANATEEKRAAAEAAEAEAAAAESGKEDEVYVSSAAGEGGGVEPSSKRSRLSQKKAGAAAGRKKQQQEPHVKGECVGEQEIDQKEEIKKEKEGLFKDEEEEETRSDKKKGTKEENFDLFKMKMSERLGSSREVDGNLLLHDAVEGGIGCQGRSSWRLLYYQHKFHLPPAAGAAASGGGGGGVAGTGGRGGMNPRAAPGSPQYQQQQQQQPHRSDSSMQAAAAAREVDTLAGDVARMYLIGLQWVLYYYYQGCRSFDWFYPFHYAPLAVDLATELQRQHSAYVAAAMKKQKQQQQQQKKQQQQQKQQSKDSSAESPVDTDSTVSKSDNSSSSSQTNSSNNQSNSTTTTSTTTNTAIHSTTTAKDQEEESFFKVYFNSGEPFSAFEQLMAVLPPYSANCMPLAHAELMRDPLSPIADFYPLDVEMDPNGKRYQWQWVVLLPFIDEERLLKKCKMLEHTLTSEERMRNRRGLDQLYVHRSHPLATVLSAVHHAGATTTQHLITSSQEAATAAAAAVDIGESQQQETETAPETETETAAEGKEREKNGQQIPLDKGCGFTGKLFFNAFAVQAGQLLESPIRGLPRLASAAFCCLYTPLNLQKPHRSVLLEGVKPYEAVLDKIDLQDTERRDRSFSGAVARRIVMHSLQMNSRNSGAAGSAYMRVGFPQFRGRDGYNRGPLLRYTPDGAGIPCDVATGAYFPGAGGVLHPPPHMLQQQPGAYTMPPLLLLPQHMVGGGSDTRGGRGGGGGRGPPRSGGFYGAGGDPRLRGMPAPAAAGTAVGAALPHAPILCYSRGGPQQQFPINPPPYPPQQQPRQGRPQWPAPPQQQQPLPIMPCRNPGQEAAAGGGGWRGAPPPGGMRGMSHPMQGGADEAAGFRRGIGALPAAGAGGHELDANMRKQGQSRGTWDGRQQGNICRGVLGAPPSNYNAYNNSSSGPQQCSSQQQSGLIQWGAGAAAASNVLPGDPWMQQQYTPNAFGGGGPAYGPQAIVPHQQQVQQQQQTQPGRVPGGGGLRQQQPYTWDMKPRADAAGGWWSAAAAGQRGAPPAGRRSPADARTPYGAMNMR